MAARRDVFSAIEQPVGVKHKTVRGGLIIGVTQAISVVISLLTIPVLTRLLEKEDFGLIAMVAVFTNFASMFVDAGLTNAIIQRREINRQQASNLFWLSAALGCVIAIVVVLGSPLVALFYGESRLTAITCALASTFVASGLTIQHQALLRRGLKFASVGMVGLVAATVGQFTGVLWAWRHQHETNDYWALVLIPITMAIVRLVATYVAFPWLPSLYRSIPETASLVGFGANLTGFRFMQYLTSNCDYMLIGWWWGSEVLGFYERSFRILMFPLQRLLDPFTNVLAPALARIANNPVRFNQIVGQIYNLLLLTLVPGMLMLIVGADPFVTTLFGPGWERSIPVLRWLAVAGTLVPLHTLTAVILTAQGKGRQLLRFGIWSQPTAIAGFLIGLPFGPTGVAAGYAITGYVCRLPMHIYWLRHIANAPVLEFQQSTFVAMPYFAVVVAGNFACLYFMQGAPPAAIATCSLAFTALAILANSAIVPRSRNPFWPVLSLLRRPSS